MSPHRFDFTPVRLSTNAFAPERRLAMWREVYDRELANFYGREVGSFDIEPLNDEPFCAAVTLRSLPGMGVAFGHRSDARYHRPSDHAVRSSDNLMFAVVTQGIGMFSQRDRDVTLGVGEAVLFSATEPSTSTLRSAGQLLTLCVPRQAISSIVGDVGSVLQRLIPRHEEALRLLLGYLGVLLKMSELPGPELQRMVVNHVYHLVASALGATRDGMEAAQTGGIRAARLATICADVQANLSDARLSAKTISRRHGVSDRYVHRLFAETGQSFGRFVEEERLKLAFAMLTRPTRAGQKIGEIASAVGFPQHSAFNRAFRRRFGDTPSGVRRNREDLRAD
jgi:AraC-like DNA-binding protein